MPAAVSKTHAIQSQQPQITCKFELAGDDGSLLFVGSLVLLGMAGHRRELLLAEALHSHKFLLVDGVAGVEPSTSDHWLAPPAGDQLQLYRIPGTGAVGRPIPIPTMMCLAPCGTWRTLLVPEVAHDTICPCLCCPRLGQTGPDWTRLGQTGPDWTTPAKTWWCKDASLAKYEPCTPSVSKYRR